MNVRSLCCCAYIYYARRSARGMPWRPSAELHHFCSCTANRRSCVYTARRQKHSSGVGECGVPANAYHCALCGAFDAVSCGWFREKNLNARNKGKTKPDIRGHITLNPSVQQKRSRNRLCLDRRPRFFFPCSSLHPLREPQFTRTPRGLGRSCRGAQEA